VLLFILCLRQANAHGHSSLNTSSLGSVLKSIRCAELFHLNMKGGLTYLYHCFDVLFTCREIGKANAKQCQWPRQKVGLLTISKDARVKDGSERILISIKCS
jgi:hypothetical protein